MLKDTWVEFFFFFTADRNRRTITPTHSKEKKYTTRENNKNKKQNKQVIQHWKSGSQCEWCVSPEQCFVCLYAFFFVVLFWLSDCARGGRGLDGYPSFLPRKTIFFLLCVCVCVFFFSRLYYWFSSERERICLRLSSTRARSRSCSTLS